MESIIYATACPWEILLLDTVWFFFFFFLFALSSEGYSTTTKDTEKGRQSNQMSWMAFEWDESKYIMILNMEVHVPLLISLKSINPLNSWEKIEREWFVPYVS